MTTQNPTPETATSSGMEKRLTRLERRMHTTWAVALCGIVGAFAIGHNPNAVAQGFSVTLSSLAARMNVIETQSLTPIGTIVAFGGNGSVPNGWMPCMGDTVSATLYPELAQRLGTSWGAAPNGQVKLPNLQGLFLRGMDYSANYDPDATNRVLGEIQLDSFRTHDHPVIDPGHSHTIQFKFGSIGYAFGGAQYASNLFNEGGFNSSVAGTPATTSISVASAGGDETRPVNVGINYIIRVK